MSSTPPTPRFGPDFPAISRAKAFTVSRWSNSVRAKLGLLLRVLAALVGGWLCLRVVRQLDWTCVVRDVRHVGAGAALLVLMPLVGNFVHMLGWRGLLPVQARPRIGRALAIFLTAQAGNEVGSGVLGESFKISHFPPELRAAAVRAVVLDNLTALVALLAVVLSIGSALGGRLIERVMPQPLAFGALALLVLCGTKLSKRAFAADSPGNVWGAFLAHYFGKLWIVADFALWLSLVARATWHASAALGLVTTVACVLGAPIPGQMGVVEAALGGSAAWVGVATSTLLSVALLRRVRGLLWIALGAVLLWRLRAPAPV